VLLSLRAEMQFSAVWIQLHPFSANPVAARSHGAITNWLGNDVRLIQPSV
jgi:hypothetical protein